jgi:hypothetical protein
MNTSNTRTERNNRTTNTVATRTTAGMLTEVVKPATACREANNNMEITSARVEKPTTLSRDASISSRNSQLLEHWQQSTVTLAAAETVEKSQMSTAEGRPAMACRDASNSRDANNSTSIIRTSTATVWSPTTHDFSGKFEKNLSESLKIRDKRHKKE